MKRDYAVFHSDPNSVEILENQEERASLQKIGNGLFNLQDKNNNQSWTLSNKVDGEMRPFSMTCCESRRKPDEIKQTAAKPQLGESCFKIKDHIFFHNDNFYSIGEALPEGASQRDHLGGSKFICRLVNFPFAHLDHIDEETKHQMKRHRGVPVAEMNGLGADGYHLKLYEDELADIGLQLAASTYLIYSTR